jgi:hypothetical protein
MRDGGRKSMWPKECQSYFSIPLTQGREMIVESLLISTGYKANPFFSPFSFSKRPR